MPCPSVVLTAYLLVLPLQAAPSAALAPLERNPETALWSTGIFAPWLAMDRVRSTWDFLGPLGSISRGDDFTVVDVKFLMSAQWQGERGASFGLLPYPIGQYPRHAFTRDIPTYHLSGHVVSWWDLDHEAHFSIAEPFLLNYNSDSGNRRQLDVGPWGILSRYSSGPRRTELTFLTVPGLQASVLRCQWSSDGGVFELFPAPFLSLIAYRRKADAGELSFGPFGVLLDLDVGPDRFAFSLTPLLRYERLGSSRRLRLFFIDALASGVFVEDP
jgi:hypothetical protein